MIEIKDKKDCCGCWACYNACPKQCITMEEDNEGFRYPQVNKDVCIDCHLCEKVCPILNGKTEEKKSQKAYLLQIKDDKIRKESTSGGSFTAIASWILMRGGVVFGVAFDDTLTSVSHKYAEDKEGLESFRYSKYVQSNIGDTFKQVKSFLNAGRWVAYSGTPCQIEGLISYLRKPYEKLVLIDVVCYGIPSPGMFRKYIEWQHRRIGGEFTRFLFREKILSYNYTSVSIYNEDSSKDYHRGVERDKYMRSFFCNRNVRPSCYACCFKKRYRPSDFTIWDCYDIRKFSKSLDEEGTNRVLAHTSKATKILEEIKDSIRIEEYGDIDYFIRDEKAMTASVLMPQDRERFWDDYQRMDFDTFLNKWFPDNIKVRLNSLLRMMAFRLGVYNKAKRIVKIILHKN